MANQAKVIRSQLRQIVQELLPELLTQELKNAMHQELAKEVNRRLEELMKNSKSVLDTIDQRSKDVQSYLVRIASKPIETTDVKLEPKSE